MKHLEIIVMEQNHSLSVCHKPCIECGEVYPKMANIRMKRHNDPAVLVGGLYCYQCVIKFARECLDAATAIVRD